MSVSDLHEHGAPLSFKSEAGIAVVTLNNPARGNALSPAMLLALEAAWGRINADPEIRVAIITGAGERHFCTGADVSALKEGEGGLLDISYAQANRFSPRMCGVAKPVICAVNGLVNGGGLHFVADSDIVIACETAQFMDSHVSVGQVSALESVGVVRRAGVGTALLMALAGSSYRMPAARAHAVGLIDLLEPTSADVMKRAFELAGNMCRNSPQAMMRSKRAIWGATELPDPAAAEHGWELLKSQWKHSDFKEGPRAFLERRAPVWNVEER